MSLDNEVLPEIPGFTIRKILGRGGMAQVYLGVQDSMNREVAIKILLPQLLVDPSFGDRFQREAQIAAKLAHPHIVAIIDVGVANDLHYMAMEYQPGGDLSQRIKEELSEKESIRIIKDIANALDFAHTSGFLHRDIKPDNILFSRSGSTVLSDFGIARAANGDSKLTATGAVIGTPHYMSPEQAMGQAIDGRADLYSLGIMFYQMLVGKVPFDGDSAMSIGIKHIRDPSPKLPPHLAKYETFIEKLLAKDPDDRWQTAADVVRSLEVLEIKETPLDGNDTLSGTAISAANNSNQIPNTQINPTQAGEKQKKKISFGIIGSTLAIFIIAGVVVWQQDFIGRANDIKETTPSVVQSLPVPAIKIAKQKTIYTKVKKPKAEKSTLKSKSVTKPDPEKIKLSGYVRDATDFLSPARLSEARIEAASRHYKFAHNLAPNDNRVQQLPEQIANSYEVLANEALLEKKWDEARRLSERGLVLLSDHRGLKKLIVKINNEEKIAKKSTTPPRKVFGGF